MKVLLSILLILTVFLCVMNYPEYSAFNLNDLISWFESLSNPPQIFSQFKDDSSDWEDKLLGGIFDIFSVISFPIRFVMWLVPIVLEFIERFVLFGLV